MTRSLSAKYSESILRLACDIALNGKQTSGKTISGGSFGSCGRYIKSLEMRSAKCARRNIFHRHFNDAIYFSIRSNTNNTSSEETAIPKIAFGVHRRAVG